VSGIVVKYEGPAFLRKGEKVSDLNITQLGGTKHLARLKTLLCTYIKALIEPYDLVVVRGILFAFPLLPLKIQLPSSLS